MKSFLSLTAILEGLTGLVLIAVPRQLVSFLLGVPLVGEGGIMAAYIAGAALITVAFCCWFSKKNTTDFAAVKAMIVYNITVPAILVYGVIKYRLTGIPLWLVVFLHAALAIWAFMIVSKKLVSEA
jgi:heme A synthase